MKVFLCFFSFHINSQTITGNALITFSSDRAKMMTPYFLLDFFVSRDH